MDSEQNIWIEHWAKRMLNLENLLDYYMKNLMKAVACNTGKKQSEETKRKRSEKLKGKRFGNNIPGSNNNHFNKKVKIDNITYDSLTQAAQHLNISIQCLSYRLKNWKKRGYEYV